MTESDLHNTLRELISNNKRTHAALDIILRELAEMKAKDNDLMGDGKKQSGDEIYKRFREEIERSL